jgi:hypothetical protein
MKSRPWTLSGSLAAGSSLLLAGCVTNHPVAARSPLAAPLPTTFSAGTTSLVLLPMGHLSSRLNTFWQVFRQKSPVTPWRLDTPPGAADNGGLVRASFSSGDPPSGKVVLGFLASKLLSFSPLVSSSDARGSWNGQAVLPRALTPVPSSLVVTSSADYALVGKHGREILRASQLGGSWQPFLSRDELAQSPGGKACGVKALTSLSAAPGGLLVGASCSHGGTSPLFIYSASVFRVVKSAAGAGQSVLGAYQTMSAEVVLLAGYVKRHQQLVALVTKGSGFVTSSPLSLSANERLEWAGADKAALYVLTASGRVASPRRERLLELAPGGSGWQLVSDLPVGTMAVGFSKGGQPEAFVVHDSRLSILRFDHISGWRKLETLNVPILYNSSG